MLMVAELEIVVLLPKFLHLAVDRVERAVLIAVAVVEECFLLGGVKSDVLILIKLIGVIKLL